ncbi:MAG: hypothetical protein A3J55_02205 [Candidatus Ryanbacteria bacterium RIFCSPHIGHO2_02_FULL_45_17b]|nr:MAG: hypothetical protein A3J55_02205 [Candidatus Ryanbacteria bacterium RIFCSPHIGHO2_02_FULL_45_17b]
MKEPKEVLDIFKSYNALVEKEIGRLLDGCPRLLMYDMMRYFFGFADETGKPIHVYGGKRFRSGLCMLIADMCGKKKESLQVATALEVFHNFTLIHDDIEDHDEFRRGRRTVWNVWGIHHGINTGDAQLILVFRMLAKAGAARDFLEKKFLEVIEGQFLDFTLTDMAITDEKATEASYSDVIRKKTVALIGAAAQVAGIVSQQPKHVQKLLWTYGTELGYAYQMCDDLVSIWGDPQITGKTKHNDIYEKKKTLPMLFLYNQLPAREQKTLGIMYSKKGKLSGKDVARIIRLLDTSGAYEYTRAKIDNHAAAAKKAAYALPFSKKKKATLSRIVDALLPDIKKK